MKRVILLAVVVLMATMSALAQIPANVKEVMKKCEQSMDYPSGLVLDAILTAKVAFISTGGTMKMCSKGDKAFTLVEMKYKGEMLREEDGFDGEQQWEYTQASGKNEKDTLIITKATQAMKNDYTIDFDIDKEYKKASMKESGLYYVITFSDPLKKDLPKKTIIKIAKDTYYLREYTMSKGLGKITMTVTKVTKGCSDNWFKLDMNRYKNAVVVRK